VSTKRYAVNSDNRLLLVSAVQNAYPRINSNLHIRLLTSNIVAYIAVCVSHGIVARQRRCVSVTLG